jgi:hypothetical protein
VSHRAQINPVAVNAQVVPVDINSGGRLMSASPAITRPHFMVGAQKKTVLGPAGWFRNALNFEAMAWIPLPE